MKMVVKLLGIPAGTLRAWESRYGVINPTRSNGGYRLYTDQDLEVLKWLKQQVDEKGISIGQASELWKEKNARLIAEPPAIIQTHTINGAQLVNYISLQNDLYRDLLNFEIDKAHSWIDRGISLYPFDDVFHLILAPLMVRVGDDWESGIITVAQEHFISQFLVQRFSHFFRLFQVDTSLPKVVSLCPPGEYHQLGLMMFSLFLRRKGHDVIYLGDNTPLEGVVSLLKEKDIKLLCLSLTNPLRLEVCLFFIEQIKQEVPNIQFVLGGKGFDGLSPDHILQSSLIGDHAESWSDWYRRIQRSN